MTTESSPHRTANAVPDPWILALVLALAAYALALAHPIDLVTADLGRHIMNGEVFLRALRPVSTNFYSYTQPDFPTLNHHWGAGLLFYLVWRTTGFAGMQFFFIGVCLAAFALSFDAARRRAGAGLAALAMVAAVPLLAERSEVRPEALSYLFIALFLRILTVVDESPEHSSRLSLLPILTIVWVNLHIYFFFGPALILLFLAQARLREPRNRGHEQDLLRALLWTSGATLLNPAGVRGALGPLTIFQNYGYRIVENQTVWFLEKLVSNPNLFIFKIWFAALLASYPARIFIGRSRPSLVSAALGLAASLMGWLALRNFALFGFLAAPLLAQNAAAAAAGEVQRFKTQLRWAGYAACAAAIGIAVSGHGERAMHARYPIGIGLLPNNIAAAQFLSQNNVAGPIFNDYDIGGYLIFALFPKERVFVDNRPEAYSESFFKDVYVPMQEDEAVWEKQDRNYGFNAIVFSMGDMTPWAQAFLIRRVQDPAWAPVFADGRVVIFLRRAPKNAGLIAAHEIPKSRFSIRR